MKISRNRDSQSFSELKIIVERTDGELGLEFETVDGQHIVTSVQEKTAAEKAGLLAGDQILSIVWYHFLLFPRSCSFS